MSQERWKKLCEFVSERLIESTTDRVIDTAIEQVIEEKTLVLLHSIDEKLQGLIRGHFQTGQNYLEDARHASKKKKDELINDARREFTFTANVDHPWIAARATMLVGVCHHLLGEGENAFRWYQRAYNLARQYGNGELSEFLLTRHGVMARLARHIKSQEAVSTEYKETLRRVFEVYAFMMPLADLLATSKTKLSGYISSDELWEDCHGVSVGIAASYNRSGWMGAPVRKGNFQKLIFPP